MDYDYDATLTEAEYRRFAPNAEIVRYLEATRKRLGLEKSEMNVLDWGSGRGELVIWLREAGYNAFGTEIRMEAASRGKDLMEARGLDYNHLVKPLLEECQTEFPSGFFHFIFTHYVLEHVADINAVTAEVSRITAPHGSGFHVYPGKLRPIEPHLFMPLVHWFPKNAARKWIVRACVACGIEPRWESLKAVSAAKKAEIYCEYSMNETFYRPYREVKQSFSKVGFEVVPVSADHPALRHFQKLPCILRKALIGVPVMAFQTVEILVQKGNQTS